MRAIAAWHRIGALFLLIGALLGGGAVMRAGLPPTFLLLAMLVGVVGAPACYAVGHHLWLHSNVARVAACGVAAVILILSGLLLLTALFWLAVSLRERFAPGTRLVVHVFALSAQIAYAVGVLWALLGHAGTRIFTRDYQDLMRCSPEMELVHWRSRFFSAPVGIVAMTVFAISISFI